VGGVEMHKKRCFVALYVVVVFLSFVTLSLAEEPIKVNINVASVEELTKLKGIGTASAQKIVEYREKNGPFAKPEDITKVKGIGPKLLETNRDKIVVK
jgi:competence protein ComEA